MEIYIILEPIVLLPKNRFLVFLFLVGIKLCPKAFVFFLQVVVVGKYLDEAVERFGNL